MDSRFFRPRTPERRDWQYDLPEGTLATPAQSAEYRRRRRRVGLYQGLALLSLPALVWFGVTFLRNPILAFIFFLACPMGLVFLVQWIGRSFCCPVCGMWFDGVDRLWPWRMSPRRRNETWGRLRWCESCGTRFELYPESSHAPDEKPTGVPADDDDGFVIL